MAWVKWSLVCEPKHLGGLGIKDIEVFNIALLAKWRWRILSVGDSHLWKQVLISRYGEICSWPGVLPSAAVVRKSSLWWRDLVILGDSLNLGSSWFTAAAKLKLGNGEKMKFWTDTWIGTEPLAVAFSSVIDASGTKDYTVAEMGQWHGSVWSWEWNWTVATAGVDHGAVMQLAEMLFDIQLTWGVPDRWIWLPDTIRGFTVKSCYEWLSNRRRGIALVSDDMMEPACCSWWKNDLPSKVLIFGWRLLLNKLPTRENLHIREILSSPLEVSCGFCFNGTEDVNHVFSRCDVVRAIWHGVFLWLNLDEEIGEDVNSILQQVSKRVQGKKGRRLQHIFWAATTWQVWLARNRTIFQGVVANVNSIIYSIKYVSWSWIVARKGRNSGIIFSDWCNCPLGCIASL